MKSINKNSRMIIVAVMLVFTLTCSETIFANNVSDTTELNYVANFQKLSLFQLKLNNKEAGSFVVTIKDVNGDPIYTKKLIGSEISQTYELKGDDAEATEFEFEIRNKITHKKQSFIVKRNPRIVEDVLISKL